MNNFFTQYLRYEFVKRVPINSRSSSSDCAYLLHLLDGIGGIW